MIDLCVVNHNTAGLMKRFLDTLHLDLENKNRNWKLHITDNDSTDEFIEFIRHWGHSYHIENLFLRKNIGYAAACNYMGSKTNSDILGLLNSDVWMTNDDVDKIQAIFDSNPDIHILGPKQRDEHGRVTHAGMTGTSVQPIMRGWMLNDPEDIMFRDRVNCVTISGSAYFIRREVWDAMLNHPKYKEIHKDLYFSSEKLRETIAMFYMDSPDALGAFLPTPHYYEETWCSYFARHLGYNVVYDGSVSIGHSWHASSAKPGEGVSHVDHYFPISREIFRNACDQLGIERD